MSIHRLLQQLEAQEILLNDTEFLAPCVAGGQVKTKVAQILYTFQPEPPDFEGWGIFKPLDGKTAEVIEEATLPQLSRYLEQCQPLRLRLAVALQGQTWLGYPVNESDMTQRFHCCQPVIVHLVTEGSLFEGIIARFDGQNWWFEDCDRKAEIEPMIQLREALQGETLPEALQFSGLTPEMKTTYDLAWQQTPAGRQRRQEQNRVHLPSPSSQQLSRASDSSQFPQERLESALAQGGGNLETFRDQGEFWQVEWRTQDGQLHISAIEKTDLTVMSSGICLSGRDQDFDLQSLVGVMEQQEYF